MLSAFAAAEVEYLAVGAYALAGHGLPRATGDLDLWVRPSLENAERVMRALREFGAPLDQVTRDDFCSPDLIFQIGIEPNRIDIITSIEGVEFDEAWTNRVVAPIDGVDVPLLGREELIRNKRAVGRPQDLADVARLEALAKRRRP